jgi:hypothetical protein
LRNVRSCEQCRIHHWENCKDGSWISDPKSGKGKTKTKSQVEIKDITDDEAEESEDHIEDDDDEELEEIEEEGSLKRKRGLKVSSSMPKTVPVQKGKKGKETSDVISKTIEIGTQTPPLVVAVRNGVFCLVMRRRFTPRGQCDRDPS